LSGNLGLTVDKTPGTLLTLTGSVANSGALTALNGKIDLRVQATGTTTFRVGGNTGAGLLVITSLAACNSSPARPSPAAMSAPLRLAS